MTPKTEKSRILLLLIACSGILLAFLTRFPRGASPRAMEPLTIETYFNAGWENDSAGGFVWVLNEKNVIIIANNQNIKIRGLLDLQIVGSPCGGSHEVSISGRSVLHQRLSISANQNSQSKVQLTLDPYVRVPVYVDVTGEGCSPSATDARLIKVQVRQPVFVAS